MTAESFICYNFLKESEIRVPDFLLAFFAYLLSPFAREFWGGTVASIAVLIAAYVWWRNTPTYKREKKLLKITERIDKFLNKHFAEEYGKIAWEGSSPLRLNATGKDLAQQARADEIAKKYIEKVEFPDGAREYDIQEICFEFCATKLEKVMEAEEVELVKQVAYSNAFELASIYKIIAFIMRDLKIEEISGDVDNIDSQDPRKKT